MRSVPTIRTYGCPELGEVSRAVTKFDQSVFDLEKLLYDTLLVSGGLGLAANQIGRPEAMFVVVIPSTMFNSSDDFRFVPKDGRPYHLTAVNPVIVRGSGMRVKSVEGCLSLPGVYEKIRRPESVVISYLTAYGCPSRLYVSGLLARVIQHEADHLKGETLLDRLPWYRRAYVKTRVYWKEGLELSARSDKK